MTGFDHKEDNKTHLSLSDDPFTSQTLSVEINNFTMWNGWESWQSTWEKAKKMDSGSRKTFSNLFSRQTVPLKNTPQVTVVSRSGGVDPNKTRFPLQPDPRRGSKRALNQVWEWERIGGAGRRKVIGSIFWDPTWWNQNGSLFIINGEIESYIQWGFYGSCLTMREPILKKIVYYESMKWKLI